MSYSRDALWFDAHCHPTDTMSSIKHIASMDAAVLTIMSTRTQDQTLVEQVSKDLGLEAQTDVEDGLKPSKRVVPSFGFHPWFSYQMYDDTSCQPLGDQSGLDKKMRHYKQVLCPPPEDEDFLDHLPMPISLSSFIEQTKERLIRFPLALVGEVGIDKAFRLPNVWGSREENARDATRTPGGREGRSLSPYRVDLKHQKVVLRAQLDLAAELQRAVSVHGVQAHGVLFELFRETWKGHESGQAKTKKHRKNDKNLSPKSVTSESPVAGEVDLRQRKSFAPRVCLHSYSGSTDLIKQYVAPRVPIRFFFSFSEAINYSSPNTEKADALVKMVPNDRILIESDLHAAGSEMDRNLNSIAQRVCSLKGWSLQDGAKILKQNWEIFIFGL